MKPGDQSRELRPIEVAPAKHRQFQAAMKIGGNLRHDFHQPRGARLDIRRGTLLESDFDYDR
jgi:hypothetical protein